MASGRREESMVMQKIEKMLKNEGVMKIMMLCR